MIAVVGGGLSLTGYNESQQLTTSTSTYTSVTTSTGVVTLTSAATRVVTTSTVLWVYHQDVTKLQGLGLGIIPGSGNTVTLCYTQEYDFHVDEGQLRISYNVTTDAPFGVGAVDFWLINDEGLHELASITNSCMDQRRVMGIAHDFRSSAYDSTVDIPSSGTYHIVFINNGHNDATITLNVDYISPLTAATMTEVHTEYSTQTSTITTEMMKRVSQPVGLGMLFFSGIGLLAVAVIAIAVAMKRRRGENVPQPATSAATPPPAASSAPPPSAPQISVRKSTAQQIRPGTTQRPSETAEIGHPSPRPTTKDVVEPRSDALSKAAPLQAAETMEVERRSSKSAKFCRKCGAKIPRDSVYCEECGTRLA